MDSHLIIIKNQVVEVAYKVPYWFAALSTLLTLEHARYAPTLGHLPFLFPFMIYFLLSSNKMILKYHLLGEYFITVFKIAFLALVTHYLHSLSTSPVEHLNHLLYFIFYLFIIYLNFILFIFISLYQNVTSMTVAVCVILITLSSELRRAPHIQNSLKDIC